MGSSIKTVCLPGGLNFMGTYQIFFGNMETDSEKLRMKDIPVHISFVSNLFPKVIIIKSNLFPICFHYCFQLFPVVSKSFRAWFYDWLSYSCFQCFHVSKKKQYPRKNREEGRLNANNCNKE